MSQPRQRTNPEPRGTPQPALRHAGAIGEPITVTGTITRKEKALGRLYSTVSTLLEINCGTSIVTLFSTARWADTAQVGEQVTVAGTVKKHQYWRGTPQTVLGWTTRIDATDDSRTDPEGGSFDAEAGWPTSQVTIRRRFPDDPNAAAPPIVAATTADDRSRP